MVTLEQMRSSNARIAESLPAGMVAVFVGGTSGIGEATMKLFAKHAVEPRIYFVGRSDRDAGRIIKELTAINPEGQYHFIQADLSLLQNVDAVCHDIKSHEELINLLFLTTGTMVTGKDTPENLYYPTAVTYYARIRLIANLLPLLQKASSLRRVVSVFGGTKEGPVCVGDLQGRSLGLPPRITKDTPKETTTTTPKETTTKITKPSPPTFPNTTPKPHPAHLLQLRAHTSSLMTLALESLALEAPDVSFVHAFPGFVRSHAGRSVRAASAVGLVQVVLNKVVGPMVTVPLAEAGERQLFVATSGRFPARCGWGPPVAVAVAVAGDGGERGRMGSASSHVSVTAGVGLVEGEGVAVARGSDGLVGGGVYSVSFDAEPQSVKVEEAVQQLREGDLVRKLWLHTVGEFVRVTGTEFV
ncbi:hypothetical protein CHGG_05146 [Chaetomium globosum CBS 148.51]|uniref:Ketoreductase (KR) domain-containing protein n=1 Tax=Chaetomium globosum (strain ATCC 6205 / CBS 148.51 / DSM 1962 / NBRC 6347 / NRRL 1970) TaxID=306901 RepID=Q2GZA0_CHAGB|nr:uncharacterized protein CHGG_05146 [Chaetomium globosum CBS 148.51]EAQ88527.1 hypothetical protein CHGG_05146 [Chaetomium globosum CBS 148.51]